MLNDHHFGHDDILNLKTSIVYYVTITSLKFKNKQWYSNNISIFKIFESVFIVFTIYIGLRRKQPDLILYLWIIYIPTTLLVNKSLMFLWSVSIVVYV